MTFFDMGSNCTSDEWDWWLSDWGMPKREPEWPPYLTCPVHYQDRRYGVDWGKGKDFTYYDEMAEFAKEQLDYLIKRTPRSFIKGTAPFERNEMPNITFNEGDPLISDTRTEGKRVLPGIPGHKHAISSQGTLLCGCTWLDSSIMPEERFELTVRDTNNLVRFLYSNGWISREQHPHVHVLLDEMIAWLEARGIKVDMDMKEIP
jgi:hypothetical protein